MMRFQTYYLILLSCCVFVMACNNEGKERKDPRVELMSQTWQYETVNIEGTKFPGEQMGNPRMIFNENGKYTMSFQNMVDSGKWYFKGDSLMTSTFANPEGEEYLVIDTLTQEVVVLRGKSNGKDLILTMRSIKEE